MEPVGITPTSVVFPAPRRITAPLPYCRSICVSARLSASPRCLSSPRLRRRRRPLPRALLVLFSHRTFSCLSWIQPANRTRSTGE